MSRVITARPRNEAVILRYHEMLSESDPSHFDEVLAPDYVQLIPQSGEMIRGAEKWAEVVRNWPPGAEQTHPVELERSVVPGSTRNLVKSDLSPFPSVGIISIEGEGDTLTSFGRVRYGDGSEWYTVSILTLHVGRIVREIMFFGTPFETPEWRKKWVEMLDPAAMREAILSGGS